MFGFHHDPAESFSFHHELVPTVEFVYGVPVPVLHEQTVIRIPHCRPNPDADAHNAELAVERLTVHDGDEV